MLKDKSLLKQAAYVGGKWIDANADNGIEVTNPATGEIIGYVPKCSAQMVETAIEVAQKAQEEWAERTAKERSLILRQWFQLMIGHCQINFTFQP